MACARRAGPAVTDSVIGVAGLAGLEPAFTLLDEPPRRGRRDYLLRPGQNQIAPLIHEPLGGRSDGMRRVLHDIPEIIERPRADGAGIEFVAPGFKPSAIVLDPVVTLAQLAEREVIEQRGAVHHMGEDFPMLDEAARCGWKRRQIGVRPDVVAVRVDAFARQHR